MRHSGTASSGAGTGTMSGLAAGRPLAAKMARTAASSSSGPAAALCERMSMALNAARPSLLMSQSLFMPTPVLKP